jgi:uncharacterized protein
MYADRADRYLLVGRPGFDGAGLLKRYNLELARAVLLDAEAMTFEASGGWKRSFRSLKLARLMVDVHRRGRRRYRVEITGPAAAYVAHPRRYGIRLARVLPALLAAPGARIDARIHYEGRPLAYALEAKDVLEAGRRRVEYDSGWERDLAEALRLKIGESRKGWTLVREDAPVVLTGGAIFLPDFTLRHRDGREALVEVVGFWTPEYLAEKLRKIRAADARNLVLVVSRRLGAGAGDLEDASSGPVVWFTDRPTASPVLEAAERVARRPTP